jgi:hypothetical protein
MYSNTNKRTTFLAKGQVHMGEKERKIKQAGRKFYRLPVNF